MKVLLTGATGFTGSHVLKRLQRDGIAVRCYVRAVEKAAALERQGVEVARGDLSDESALARACAGCDGLINVASMGFGHSPGIIRALKVAGVNRAIFVSTTAIFTQLNAPSKLVRLAAERAIRDSALKWTILRPTMIYGSGRDRNICRLIKFLRCSLVLPVFGPGTASMQPIFVDDLAAGIVNALGSAGAEGQCYNLAGAAPLSYNELVQTVARLMHRRVWLWHLPAGTVSRILTSLEHCRIPFPIKAEQIARLQEDKAFSWKEAAKDFGFSPRTFEAGVRLELTALGLLHE